MWVLRGYNPEDELAAEAELPEANQQNLETMLGFRPTNLGSTPLDPERVFVLAKLFKVPVIEKQLDYFLDFDAEVAQEAAGPARRAARAGRAR